MDTIWKKCQIMLYGKIRKIIVNVVYWNLPSILSFKSVVICYQLIQMMIKVTLLALTYLDSDLIHDHVFKGKT